MIPMRTLNSMNNPQPIENFITSPPKIVGVGGASATVRGYIDAPLIIARMQVRHPVIVVEDLSFPLLLEMDILGPHDAQLGVGAFSSIRLDVERCRVCDEERSLATHLRLIPTVAVVCEDVSLQLCAASRVTVRLPPAVLSNSYFVAEPLLSLFADTGCAALPSVNKIDGCTHVISVLNPSINSITLRAGIPIAAISHLLPSTPTSLANIASIQHLPRDQKLKKVLSDLTFDAIKLDATLKSKLRAFIREQLDVFAKCNSDVGTTDIVFHKIDTGDSRFIRQPARRVPYGDQRVAIESEIEKLVNSDIALLSTSPWASPIVMVKIKDGTLRMCVDYRRINKATKFDCFPLPRLDEALNAFAGSTVFSLLDLAIAYHQVPVTPSDVEKTAFITHFRIFQIIKMPFGLYNASSTYQRLMSIVLRGLIPESASRISTTL